MVGPFSFWRNIINIDSIGKEYLKDMMEDKPDETEEESGFSNGADSQVVEMDEATRHRLMKIEYQTERRRFERLKAIEQKKEAAQTNQAPGSTPGNNTQNTDEHTPDSSITDVE